MSWCFALINNRLAEIYFKRNKKGIKILGHCYMEKSEYKTKIEQKWTEKDIAKFRFSYRNKNYKRLIS